MTRFHRRRFLKTLAVASASLIARPRQALAAPARALGFRHLHTGETLSVEYAEGGRYLPDALAAVDRLLRDFRTGEIHPIDPGLLDLLHGLARRLDTRQSFEIISGYRSPTTNAALRRRSEGVAAHSLHMVGQAVDVRVHGVPLTRLRSAALDLKSGGVGYYPVSNFVHVDTGRVRQW
ncbi:MAG: DUF882 domain-containing protein [Acidobacteria bacterium]|nr:DUF882 domain-containing protein [Acidobacteriota bacterium]